MSGRDAGPADYERAVWSWTQHLRAGGTTPWSGWRGSADPPPGWAAPGAAQLELVRRLALPGALPGSDDAAGEGFRDLADLVLAGSGSGRGQPVQPLTWPAAAARRIGAPPVDPGDVAPRELVRLGVGTLVELVSSRVAPTAEPTPLPRRRLLARTPAFHLAGAPVTADQVRTELAGLGLLEGGPAPRVVLVAAPLDELLAQVWSARVQRGAPVRWRGFVRRWSGGPGLPPSADLPGLARHWAGEVGTDRVHVVLPGQGSPVDLVGDAVGADLAALRARRRSPARRVGRPLQRLSPAGVDVLRRVNGVLGVRLPEPQRAAARTEVARLLAAGAPPAVRLRVPPRWRDWVRDRAERMADDLAAGGYPVHGHLGELVPAPVSTPSPGAVRAVAQPAVDDVLDELVAAVRTVAGQPRRTKERA